MESVNLKENKLKEFNVCVIVPTYNNADTLNVVLDDILKFTDDIIIVNDGSTDTTEEILQSYSGLDIISYPKNKGKGYALKKGFSLAKEKKFKYAITIDSDGQHIVGDIKLFTDKLEKNLTQLLSETGIWNRMVSQRKAVLAVNFPISGFGWKPASNIRIHNPASGYIH